MTEDSARPDPVATALQRLEGEFLVVQDPEGMRQILVDLYQAGFDAGEADRRDELPPRLRRVR